MLSNIRHSLRRQRLVLVSGLALYAAVVTTPLFAQSNDAVPLPGSGPKSSSRQFSAPAELQAERTSPARGQQAATWHAYQAQTQAKQNQLRQQANTPQQPPNRQNQFAGQQAGFSQSAGAMQRDAGRPSFDNRIANNPILNDAANARGLQRAQRGHSDLVVEITNENFQSAVLDSKTLVLVDLWAPWCGPCRRIAPMIDEIAQENAGTCKVGKLNCDECPDIAKAYEVQGLPTLLIFKDGQLVDSILGAPEKERLQAALDAAGE